MGGSETGREREVSETEEEWRGREESREGGRSNEEQRPEPNWSVMPDMPVTTHTRGPPPLAPPSPPDT